MVEAKLSGALPEGSLFAGKIRIVDRVDSTNTRLKEMALAGAAEGTVLLAEEQTAGRGTQGRSFCSPRGEGLYLSVLLRPKAGLAELFQLTGRTAVAVCRAVERACSAPVAIKWLNDLYLGGRKVCGILTELSMDREGQPDYVVVGVGINLTQTEDFFRARGLGETAVSLAGAGYPVDRERLCLLLLEELERMYRAFPGELSPWLEEYRVRCLTSGRQVTFQHEGQTLRGWALAVDDNFCLAVRGEDGGLYTVSGGMVTYV